MTRSRTVDYREAELAWYREHGKYPDERIAVTKTAPFVPYVIGDWSWNRMHPDKPEVIESISPWKNADGDRQ